MHCVLHKDKSQLHLVFLTIFSKKRFKDEIELDNIGTDGTLELAAVSFSDEATYKCTTETEAGVSQSEEAIVQVKGKAVKMFKVLTFKMLNNYMLLDTYIFIVRCNTCYRYVDLLILQYTLIKHGNDTNLSELFKTLAFINVQTILIYIC